MMQQEQAQQGQDQGGGEVAKLFQNVGQGLMLIAQYVEKAVPDAQDLVKGLLQGYEQLIQVIQNVAANESSATGNKYSCISEIG